MSNTASNDKTFENAVKALAGAFPNKLLPSLAKEMMETFQEYLSDEFGTSSSTDSFSKTPGHINKRSGDLLKSFTLDEGSKLSISKTGFTMIIDSNLRYAATQNFGDKIKTTPKMEKFFWAKYIESQSEMWKRLALFAKGGGTITIKATHYFDNAIKKFAKTGMSKAYESFYRDKLFVELKKTGLI